MKAISILAVLALAAPTLAIAEPAAKAAKAAPSAEGAGSAAAKPKDRLICRREYGTGSRTNSIKTCLTRSEWNRVDRGEEFTIQRSLDGRAR